MTFMLTALVFLLFMLECARSKLLEPKDINRFGRLGFKLIEDPKLHSIDFTQLIKDVANGRVVIWRSVTTVRLEHKFTRIYVSAHVERGQQDQESSVRTSASLLLSCDFVRSTEHPAGFTTPNQPPCQIVEAAHVQFIASSNSSSSQDGYVDLGSTLDSIELDTHAVLVNCDPLWRNVSLAQQVPRGFCHIRCTNGLKSYHERTRTFAFDSSAGNSISLAKTTYESMLDLLVAVPTKQTARVFRVSPIDQSNQYMYMEHITNLPPSVLGSAMIKSVLWSGNESAYWISSRTDNPGPVKRLDFILHQRANSLRRPSSEDPPQFDGFGHALEKVMSGEEGARFEVAVLASAPYRTGSVGPNAGAVFMFCQHERETRIDGPEAGLFFGYSVRNVGDLDRDGMEDFAVGSPAFNRTGSGRVHIFLTRLNCSYELFQVLHAPTTKAGSQVDGFGVQMSRAVDFDHDGQHELVVLSASAKQHPVSIYSIAPTLKAVCRVTSKSQFVKKTLKVKAKIILFDKEAVPFPPKWEMFHRLEVVVDQPHKEHVLASLKNATHEYTWHPTNSSGAVMYRRYHLATYPDYRISNGQLSISAELEASVPLHEIHLDHQPLFVSFRAFEASEACRKTWRGREGDCPTKSHQPLIDWAHCSAEVPISMFHCTDLDCSSDMRLSGPLSIVDPEPVKVNGSTATLNILHSNSFLEFDVLNDGPADNKLVHIHVQTLQFSQSHRLKVDKLDVFTKRGNVWRMDTKGDLGFHRYSETEEAITFVVVGFAAGRVLRFRARISLSGFDDAREVFRQKPDKLPRVQVEIRSPQSDPRPANNLDVLHFQFAYQPQLQIQTVGQNKPIMDARGGPAVTTASVVESQRMNGLALGPRIRQAFMVANKSPRRVDNITLLLDIPYLTHLNEPLVYMTQILQSVDDTAHEMSVKRSVPLIRLSNGSTMDCQLLSAAVLNPYNLKLYDRSEQNTNAISSREGVLLSTSAKRFSYVNEIRRKNLNVLPCPFDRSGSSEDLLSCVTFKCHLTQLEPNAQASVEFTGWFWAETAFERVWPDIDLVTQLQVASVGPALPDTPLVGALPVSYSPSHHRQRIVFLGIERFSLFKLPLWPIVVGVVLGVLFVAALSHLLYACGFFDRKLVARARQSIARRRRRSSRPSHFGKVIRASRLGVDEGDGDYLVEASPSMLCSVAPEPIEENHNE